MRRDRTALPKNRSMAEAVDEVPQALVADRVIHGIDACPRGAGGGPRGDSLCLNAESPGKLRAELARWDARLRHSGDYPCYPSL
jgi:hypothetical protein